MTSSRLLLLLLSPTSITCMRGSLAKAFNLPPSSWVTCMALGCVSRDSTDVRPLRLAAATKLHVPTRPALGELGLASARTGSRPAW